ncbi:TAXI family TRAP transporter solute-binding subunit [Desertibacillus haloalkaliphilus]|uniref:TAXI family TRAP transporter solute-binding subunit n=1 Tax=Desertibacillus haloalkaliphilus TaxID=1328930 RepID=UPI001C254AA3|nr:TAXI family TRAP transporter solute-binding subunit [Desertibacillus haloalkaliphilus]MBU8906600.1 TAXI family TRAP transporter solute-binding subunit [Desertibacillus haloalkaliphilus]
MFKKLVVPFILGTSLLAAGCSSDGAGGSGEDRINFATGTTTGIYYPSGSIISDLWSNEIEDITASSQASNGSVQNINFIQQGEADVGWTTAGVAIDAYNGDASFDGRAYEDLRVIAALYPNYNYFVARDGGGVEEIADVEGKQFAPGATGSATETEAERTIGLYGLTFDDVNTNFVGFTEATDLMRNNQIDAAMVNAGIPTSAVSEMLSTADGKLLSMEQDKIDELMADNPFYVQLDIPAGTYENQDYDVKTVAQYNFIVADARMSDEVAYELVSTLWENLDDIKGSHGVFEQFDVQLATEGIANVPVHPGAERYYQEQGVIE